MRVSTPAVIVPLIVLWIGCAPSNGTPEEQNEDAVVAMFEEGWNRGRTSVFSSTVADSVRFHYAGTPRWMDRREMGAVVRQWREAFPDLHMELGDVITEDDLAAARLTLTGTHEGPWRGVEPTGETVRMALMMMFRFHDGRMVELWESDDQLGLRRQLGILQEGNTP